MKSTALLLLLGITAASAQYSLEWSTSDAGGGESAGGTYSLHGTIAQTDAAPPLSGGSISLDGGYWTFSDPQPALPDLVMLLDGGFVVLAWEETPLPVVLESSADLSLWEPVEPQPESNSWISPQSERSFFRLRAAP